MTLTLHKFFKKKWQDNLVNYILSDSFKVLFISLGVCLFYSFLGIYIFDHVSFFLNKCRKPRYSMVKTPFSSTKMEEKLWRERTSLECRLRVWQMRPSWEMVAWENKHRWKPTLPMSQMFCLYRYHGQRNGFEFCCSHCTSVLFPVYSDVFLYTISHFYKRY